jgi:2-amino-4-hydroxy-6-hydroxymethyldihydropteridine diphosphokinase
VTATPPADVFVGMGSNVGDRLAHLRAAVARLEATPGVRVTGTSPVYETEALVRPGTPPQRDHLNAVVRLSVDLSPLDLLAELHAAERAAGRDHDAEPWSPRPLDLDVLLWGDETLDLPGLSVPHPRLRHRRFALAPLADLAPERVVGGRTVGEWLASTADDSRVERTAWAIAGEG